MQRSILSPAISFNTRSIHLGRIWESLSFCHIVYRTDDKPTSHPHGSHLFYFLQRQHHFKFMQRSLLSPAISFNTYPLRSHLGQVSHSSHTATLPTSPSKFGRSVGYWRRGKWSRYRCRPSLIAWSPAHQPSNSLYIQHCDQ